MWAGDPIDYSGPHLSDPNAIIPLLAAMARMKVDDVFITTDNPVQIEHLGEMRSVTRYTLNGSQVERILKKITGQDAVIGKVGSGTDFDKAITVDDPDERDEHGEPIQHRFRLNITGGFAGNGLGFDATLRRINAVPMTLDQVGFPETLRDRFAVTQGSFLIAGPTGSGKSTTFSACIREILEGDTAIKGNILEYSAPTEYLFHTIRSRHSRVMQCEIGTHLPSFAAGVRNALRRHPKLTIIGEIRDTETIMAANELASGGHPLFGTTHANSSIEILQRLVQNFPVAQYDQVFAALVNTSRLFMSQIRVRVRDTDQMTVLRDWLYLTNDDKRALLAAGYSGHIEVLRQLIQNPANGRSMRTSIDEAYDAGLLDDGQRLTLYKTYGEEDGV
ncbi:ATPase, T2SS/T4P/T4SS family [Paracoccus sp. TOH]|uniref:ATPase, T2SS/T4P/T4SS family n=1 Tax=Paracoccus sp. TOH TaxID=1263728 RepID=UPI0025B0F9DB|nr:ATPase, T2SS/T4P/T4SS family [Paracoccus sp. TOH]WJS87247.1 Flp pilus assembly complex ATPase component TadA [Paracoccus sp. TOH]